MAESQEQEGRTVVVGMDGSNFSDEAFQWFMQNVYRDTDHVILIHVPEYRNMYTTMAPMEVASPELIKQLYEEETKKTQEMLNLLKKKLVDAGIGGKVKCEPGDPGDVIIKVANEVNADLIVSGCRGLGTIRRTFMGSVSDYLIHHSRVPVVVCRHKHHAHGQQKMD